MPKQDIRRIVDMWQEQYPELGKLDFINYVQIFENKGAMMGCSNPHPHGQIWASRSIPQDPALEAESFVLWQKEHNTCLLCEYVRLEQEKKVRVVCENQNFLALVPFWALWPFEVMIVSKNHLSSLSDFNDAYKNDLAELMGRIACRYDNLFECSFPYSMGLHQAPTDKKDRSSFHFHMHFYPPLLRSATIRKFMVGYEMLAEPQRDITAEQSAARLRELPEIHYKNRKE
jgi:UDPglucose--hexose-1-phosphate uridylyltransferase